MYVAEKIFETMFFFSEIKIQVIPRFRFDIHQADISQTVLVMLNKIKALSKQDQEQVLKFLKDDQYHKIPVSLFPSQYQELLRSAQDRRMKYLIAMDAIYGSTPRDIINDIIHKEGLFDPASELKTVWNFKTTANAKAKAKSPAKINTRAKAKH